MGVQLLDTLEAWINVAAGRLSEPDGQLKPNRSLIARNKLPENPYRMYRQRSLKRPRPYPPKSQSKPLESIRATAPVLAPGTFNESAVPFVP